MLHSIAYYLIELLTQSSIALKNYRAGHHYFTPIISMHNATTSVKQKFPFSRNPLGGDYQQLARTGGRLYYTESNKLLKADQHVSYVYSDEIAYAVELDVLPINVRLLMKEIVGKETPLGAYGPEYIAGG